MIKYALQCERGHGFESWFPSSDDYDAQVRRGLVECPQCGSLLIQKQIMAPHLRLQSTQEAAFRQQGSVEPVPAEMTGDEQLTALPAESMLKLRTMIREMHAHVQANTEDVGAQFAEESRKIHYGESEERGIRGKVTQEEARELHEEGISFLPLPPLPDDQN
ncbi:MAG: DUF1178 family protein [Beijerinckiaceae bacterium]